MFVLLQIPCIIGLSCIIVNYAKAMNLVQDISHKVYLMYNKCNTTCSFPDVKLTAYFIVSSQ